MNDVNEWSTEYNVEVGKIDNWQNSPHYWNKKVLFIKPLKRWKLQVHPWFTNVPS